MESSIRAHLIPVLGKIPVTGIGVKQVQTLISGIKSSKKTRENVVGDLSSILNAARKWYPNVPAIEKADLYFAGAEPQEPFVFTPTQMRAILNYFSTKPTWDLFFTLLPLSGFRSGEILGLRVSDSDFEHNKIWVKQSVWNGKTQTVKTRASKKPVPMTSLVRAKLLEYLKHHKHELLFVNRNGRPYSRDKVVAKVLHPALKELGIQHEGRRCGLHAFRHGLASMLVESASTAIAQRQLRHANASTTLGIYAHVIPEDHSEAMEEIQSVLIGTPAEGPVATAM